MTMEDEKSGFGAANAFENTEFINDANIVQKFGTNKHEAENVTSLFECNKPKANRIPFLDVLNGKTKERGVNDFPPSAEDLSVFPLWGLPCELQDVINDVAKGYKCSPTIPAVAMLATASGAIGKGVESIIDNHHNYPSIWPIIVGTPSTSKSGPSSFFTDPLDEADEQAENAYNAELANWINGGRKGQEPKLHQRVIGVTSDEMMLKILSENNGVGFLKIDEFATMAGSWGRYAKNGNGLILGILESIFSQQNTKVSTIARGTTTIKKPVLSIFATTNPCNFQRIFRSFLADNGGIFERFLPVFVSKVKGKEKRKRHTISEQSRQVWREYVDRLLHLRPGGLRLDEHPAAAEWRIKAEDYWQQCGEIAEECEPNQLGEIQSSLYCKASYTLYRVAMVVAILNGDSILSAPSMRYAAEVTQFFLTNQLAAAVKLLRPEESTPNKTETMRYLFYHYPSAVISRLADALKLGESGRVWLTNIKNGRK